MLQTSQKTLQKHARPNSSTKLTTWIVVFNTLSLLHTLSMLAVVTVVTSITRQCIVLHNLASKSFLCSNWQLADNGNSPSLKASTANHCIVSNNSLAKKPSKLQSQVKMLTISDRIEDFDPIVMWIQTISKINKQMQSVSKCKWGSGNDAHMSHHLHHW